MSQPHEVESPAELPDAPILVLFTDEQFSVPTYEQETFDLGIERAVVTRGSPPHETASLFFDNVRARPARGLQNVPPVQIGRGGGCPLPASRQR
jgi:hypothetical protein